MRDIKILIVIDTLGRGGAEQVLVNVLPTLLERGYSFDVAAARPPYDLARTLEGLRIPVYRLDLKEPWNLVRAVTRLTQLIRRLRPDVIHSSLFFANTYMALTRPLTPNIIRVATFQNVDYYVYPANTIIKRLKRMLDVFLTHQLIDHYTAVSHAVADYCAAELGLSNITVIPNAIVTAPEMRLSDSERQSLRLSYGLCPTDFVLAMVGRLVAQKGHRFLLDAVRILDHQGLQLKAMIVGAGPLKPCIEQHIADAGLRNRVAMISPMDHETLMRLLVAADAFVMPSIYEGLPLAAAEAMSLGLPVVATRVSGLSELIEDRVSGLLVTPQSPEALAEAIASLMTDSDLCQRLGAAAVLRVDRNYSVRAVGDLWESFYRDLTAQIAC
jgi:glycosyltransferase involved in cell wall biosynthesis